MVNASKSDAIFSFVVCGGREGMNGCMLLYSECSRACHVGCAELESVPEGDWWCDGCDGQCKGAPDTVSRNEEYQ